MLSFETILSQCYFYKNSDNVVFRDDIITVDLKTTVIMSFLKTTMSQLLSLQIEVEVL